jgi:hypothetical protein
MTLATLDFPAAHPAARSLRSAAPAALAGADLVVWDPAGFAGAAASPGPDGRPTLDVAGSEAALALSRHWRAELANALRDGAAVCVLVPARAGFGVHTLQEIVEFDLLEPLPGGAPSRRALAAPEPVRCITGEPFRSFLDAAGDLLRTVAELPTPPGRAICVAEATGRVAGCYDYRHPGHLLLLPALRVDATAADRERVLRALSDLVRRLRRSGRLGPLAPWATGWSLPGEQPWREAASAAAARQREAATALEQARASIETLELVKQLAAGDAAGAGRAAAFVMHALGAYAQPGMDDAGSVAFEHRGRFAVATLATVDGADAAARAIANARAFAASSGGSVRAALLYCAENDLPPPRRRGPSEALRAAADAAGVPVVTADELLAAYLERDAAVLDRLIGADPLRD